MLSKALTPKNDLERLFTLRICSADEGILFKFNQIVFNECSNLTINKKNPR